MLLINYRYGTQRKDGAAQREWQGPGYKAHLDSSIETILCSGRCVLED